jgi:hypothetical protein
MRLQLRRLQRTRCWWQNCWRIWVWVRSNSHALCDMLGVGGPVWGTRRCTGYRVESWLWGVGFIHLSALRLVCAPPSVYSSCILLNLPPSFISYVRAIQYSTVCHIRQLNQPVLHGTNVTL